MDSPASSSLIRFRARDGTISEQPIEWEPFHLELMVPTDDWHQIRLTVQGEPKDLYLARSGDIDVVRADWPRSNAGHYRLRARWPGGELEQIVTVQPQKLSYDAFQRLLEDLEQNLPVDLAISLQRAGALVGIGLPKQGENTVASEVARLRRTLNGTDNRIGLLRILQIVSEDPHHALSAVDVWTPRWSARRPHPTELLKALIKPHNKASDNWPNQILDRHVQHDWDVYENRVLKLFIQQVEFRLRTVKLALAHQGNESLEKEIDQFLFQLRVASSNARFLHEVSPLSQSPTNVSMVMIKEPVYRAMFQGFLEFRRSPFVRFEHPKLSAPLNNLPSLYQAWGVILIIKVLIEEAAKQGFTVRSHDLVHLDRSGVFVEIMPRNRPVVELEHNETGVSIRAWPERSYSPNTNSEKVRSISYSQRPDLVVEISDSDGQVRLIIFDPKYKLRGDVTSSAEDELPRAERALQPIKADIDKMHTYRDAIRDANGHPIVEFAATLYPGQSKHFELGIAALGAIPGQTDSFANELSAILQYAFPHRDEPPPLSPNLV